MSRWQAFLASLNNVGSVTCWVVVLTVAVLVASVLAYWFTLFMKAFFS